MLSDLEYTKIIRFLECIKIHNGAICLNKTLHNHSIINQALLDYETNRITEIEREITKEEN